MGCVCVAGFALVIRHSVLGKPLGLPERLSDGYFGQIALFAAEIQYTLCQIDFAAKQRSQSGYIQKDAIGLWVIVLQADDGAEAVQIISQFFDGIQICGWIMRQNVKRSLAGGWVF